MNTEGSSLLEHALRDLGYAIRAFAKRPVLLATTTISIGVGVGFNVAVYSVTRTLLFKPVLTAAVPADLVLVRPGLSYPNYVDLRAHDALLDMTLMQASTVTYQRSDGTTSISARVVSENFFEVLGVQAFIGRTFGSKDDVERIRDPNIVVISYGFWQRLGGYQNIVGQTLTLNGWPYRVAGVLPRGFHSTIGPLVSPSVYVPLGPRVNVGLDARNAAQFDAVARLRSGLTLQQTSAALRVMAQEVDRQFPEANQGLTRTLSIEPLRGLVQLLPAQAERTALTLAAALYAVVGLILLVACANVAGLLLARGAERVREISIRIALGATRGRIVLQFLSESLVVATLGCLAGSGLWMIVTTALPKMSLIANAGIDIVPTPVSWLQCGLLILVITIACGIGPALTVSRFATTGLTSSQGGFGPKRWGVRQALVVGQVGISFVLLSGATALLFSIARQQMADPGFDVGHTISIQIRPPTTSARPQFFRLRDTLAALPGVEAVSSGDLPIGLVGFDRVYKGDGAEDGGFSVQVHRVGPQYLETLGVRLLRGRDLRDEDVRETSTSITPIIVGESLARRYLGSVDAVGQELVLGRDAENGMKARRLQIVGVSQDGTVQVFGGDRVPVLYVPTLSTSLVVRLAGSSARALRMLEQSVEVLQPGAEVTVRAMSDQLSAVLLPVRAAAVLFTVLGGIGLVLAMTGLHGLITYTANTRRIEMGLRMALGATWSAIMRLIMRDAVLMVGAGSMAGGILSLALIRAIWPLLAAYQGAFVPLVLLVVLVLTLAVGIGAALRPALSAARADPMVVLRQD